jgi:hypothetical protein
MGGTCCVPTNGSCNANADCCSGVCKPNKSCQ